jgi:hypothetical protein
MCTAEQHTALEDMAIPHLSRGHVLLWVPAEGSGLSGTVGSCSINTHYMYCQSIMLLQCMEWGGEACEGWSGETKRNYLSIITCRFAVFSGSSLGRFFQDPVHRVCTAG